MRFGIRLQIVLALLALLALAFFPLFAAVASLTKVALVDVRESSARSLGRAVAAHVAEATLNREAEGLLALLTAQLGVGGVAAIGVYDERGEIVARVGEQDALEVLPTTAPIQTERIRSLRTTRSPAIEVIVPGPGSVVATVLRTNDDAGKTAPLLRLVALYTGVGALALLVFAYIALGRLIVRPIDALSSAARRVAAGALHLDAPRSGPAELLDLGASLAEMTAKLRADENKMREHIAELEQRARELREAQEKLIRSERLASVGRLAAGLAHEIGNPLAAILGLHDILLEGGLDPREERDFLRRTRSEAERIHLILRNLLDFARPGAGPRDENAESGDLVEAIADVVALVRPQKAFRDLVLEIEISDGPLRVRLARDRIVQVVLNLLLNAADATQGSGRIRIQATRADMRARLTIEDDGAGVPASIRARLFEPFTTTKEVGKGTGLGLAVCRGVVEAAGGSIALDESYDAHGARFVIDLPIESSAPVLPSGLDDD